MGLDLKDGVGLMRRLVKQDELLKKKGVFGPYDSVTLSNAATRLEEIIEFPKNDFGAIRGEQPYLGWLIIMAFRYAVGRHPTQALKDIEGVIFDNMHLLCDDFVCQMVREVQDQYRTWNVAVEHNREMSFMSNPNYLEPFRKRCLAELERRGVKFYFCYDRYDKVPD